MSLSDEQLALFVAVKNNNESAIRDLVSAGVDVNTPDDEFKRTPLFYAVIVQCDNAIHQLIKAGANVNAQDNNGRTCLFFAVSRGLQNTVHALINAGADVNITNKDGKTALFGVKWNKNETNLRALIHAGADVNKTDNDGQTALFRAVVWENTSMVQALIDAGADVNKTDNHGQTALLRAAYSGNESIVRALIDGGANVNKTDNHGQTALFNAVNSDNESIVRALIDGDADVNKTDNHGQTALFSAVNSNNESILWALIDGGTDVNKTDYDGQTALFSAVNSGNESIVRALIDAGADVNKTDYLGQTALFNAVNSGNESIVRALIDAGADVNKTDYLGQTALFNAVNSGNESIVRALIDAGADVNKTDDLGQTALFNAVYSANESIVRALIDAGADVNKTDCLGQTALFNAVYTGNESIVRALIDGGADVNNTDNHGRTALFNAVKSGNESIVRALIDAGADVNKTYYLGQTALFNAVNSGNESIVRALIDAGADVNKTDNYGETALLRAFELEDVNENIVRALIDGGADVNKTDNHGRTALFSAFRYNNMNIVRALVNAGAEINKKVHSEETAFYNAVINNKESVVRASIESGVDVNIENFCKSPLVIAVLNDNESIVRALIDGGADVNKTNNDGQTALFIAVYSSNESIVQALIDAGADVNKTNNAGKTALLRAFQLEDVNESIVRALIDGGADVNKTDNHGQTALLRAVYSRNESIVRALIDRGADVNKTDNHGETALFSAFKKSNMNIVRTLVNAGAEININVHSEETAFYNAVINNNESVVRASIESGVDVNIDNFCKSPLVIAVLNDNESIVRALIDGGADVNKTDNVGQTALFSAVNSGNESIVRALIDACADVNKTDNVGQTALFSAVNRGNESIVRALIDGGADVNKTDNDGQTALLNAVYSRSESIVRTLIHAGADVNKTDNYGETALFNVVYMDSESILRALIDGGADVNKTDNHGQTALLHAVYSSNESIVRALIHAGADVNKTNNAGETALLRAFELEDVNENIVRALIDGGADVNKTDNHGRTALFYAFYSDESIVWALIDAGADVNKTDNDGQTALLSAFELEDVNENVVQALIVAGADNKHLDYEGESPLFHLVRRGFPKSVIISIEKGNAMINLRNRYGRTPLFYALQESSEVARILMDNGGILRLKDNCNLSILSFFIEEMLKQREGYLWVYPFDATESFELLFEKGVTKTEVVKALIQVLFCKLAFACTPLAKERSSYSFSMKEKHLRILVAYAEDATKQAIESMLAQVSSEHLSRAVSFFVSLGADPNSADSHGNTLLHYVTLLPFVGVSQTEVMEVCRLLRQFGATTNFRNHQGQTPLLFCLSELSHNSKWLLRTDGVKMLIEMCRLLLRCGTMVNDTLPNGKSVFHLMIDLFQQGLRLQDDAVRTEVLNEILKLLQLFSDASAEQAKYFTNGSIHLYLVLHSWASLTLPSPENYSSNFTLNFTFEELLKAILQPLLKCGARPNTRDDDEKTPLHHCKTWGAVKLLIDAGAKADDVDSSGHPTLLIAAEKQTFLVRSERFYPDVLEDPTEFWRTAIDKKFNPWTVDQHGNSVLSIMIKFNAFVLAKALIEITREEKHIEEDEIAYSLLNAICKDQSTQARWKTNLVEIILESRQRNLLKNLHLPLRFCCKSILEFGCSDGSSSDFSDDSASDILTESASEILEDRGTKRKRVDHELEKNANTQPLLKKIKTDGQCSAEVTEHKENNIRPVSYDSVHCEIATLLLSYGAECRTPDSSGKSCLDLAEPCPKLKHLLTQPKDVNKISKRIPWDSVSKRYEATLSKVSRGQEKKTISTFWYHKDPIGSGSYGDVFPGVNEKDGREVAIKRIVKLRMVRPEDKREITNLTKLADCQQVVTYVSFLEDEHFSYIVLELMEGDLEHYFSKGPVTQSEKVLLCKDVTEGLRYLHKKEIIHRDLKPGNILYKIHPRLCLKIGDFGLSRYCVNPTSTSVYGGTVAGTRCWIAPEILSSQSGESFTTNSDTFSCGLLLHYILSNQRHPFSPASSTDPHLIEDNIRKNQMEGWDTDISPEATDLIKKMLKENAKERISPSDAVAHPFFWSKSKKKDFLVAVGNQEEFQFHGRNLETDLEKDLDSVFQTVVKCDSWDDPRNKFMPKLYSEMKEWRKYNTKSTVDLVRLIRNSYSHFYTLSSKIRRMLVNYTYLKYFPDLVLEVFKAVTHHEWNTKKLDIKDVLTKYEG